MESFQSFLESVVQSVYHVTYYTNLEGIAASGLDFNRFGGKNFEKPHLQRHSRTGTFFSNSIYGVKEWIGTLEEMSNDAQDNPIANGLVPVILKFQLNRNKQLPDKFSSPEYSRKTDRLIPEQGILVWSGRQWLPIADWERVNISEFIKTNTGTGYDHIKDPYLDAAHGGYPLPKS